MTGAGSLARRAAFLAQRVFASDLIYVEPVFLGFNLTTDASKGDNAKRTSTINRRDTENQMQTVRLVQKSSQDGGNTHPSGTLKDVNLSPVSSFFALGIPRGILPVPAFDLVVPEVASLDYFSICS